MASEPTRFGMPWTPAGPWMREYVRAVRAVWDCWQHGTPLDVKGPHYNINLMVPLFNPGPIEHPGIPIQLAAVNPVMSQIVGFTGDRSFLDRTLAAGTYFVQIDGYNGATGPWNLDVRVIPP